MPHSDPEIPPAHELHRLVHDLLERLDRGEPIDLATLPKSYHLAPDQWEALLPTLETLQAFGLFAGRRVVDSQRNQPYGGGDGADAKPLEPGPLEKRPLDDSSRASDSAEGRPYDGRLEEQAQRDTAADATHRLQRRLDAGAFDRLLRDLWRARQRFKTGPQD